MVTGVAQLVSALDTIIPEAAGSSPATGPQQSCYFYISYCFSFSIPAVRHGWFSEGALAQLARALHPHCRGRGSKSRTLHTNIHYLRSNVLSFAVFIYHPTISYILTFAFTSPLRQRGRFYKTSWSARAGSWRPGTWKLAPFYTLRVCL